MTSLAPVATFSSSGRFHADLAASMAWEPPQRSPAQGGRVRRVVRLLVGPSPELRSEVDKQKAQLLATLNLLLVPVCIQCAVGSAIFVTTDLHFALTRIMGLEAALALVVYGVSRTRYVDVAMALSFGLQWMMAAAVLFAPENTEPARVFISSAWFSGGRDAGAFEARGDAVRVAGPSAGALRGGRNAQTRAGRCGILRRVHSLPTASLRSLRPLVLGLSLVTSLLAASCGARSDLLEGTTADAGSAGASSTGSGGTAGVGGGTTTGVGGTTTTTGIGGSVVASAIETCVFASSCAAEGNSGPRFTASTCLDGIARLGWWFESPETMPNPHYTKLLLECGQKAQPGNCVDLAGCFGASTWYGLSSCREGGQCDPGSPNGILSWDLPVELHCSEPGSTCVNLWSDALRACCNTEMCAESGVTCDGNKASICGGWGEHVNFDCGVTGQVCVPGSQPWTPCKGSGACDPMTMNVACMGNTAIWCSNGGYATYDCASTTYRTVCNEGVPSTMIPCRPAEYDCDPENGPDYCTMDGTSLRVCVNGAWQTVSCTQLGFDGCHQDSDTGRCVHW